MTSIRLLKLNLPLLLLGAVLFAGFLTGSLSASGQQISSASPLPGPSSVQHPYVSVDPEAPPVHSSKPAGETSARQAPVSSSSSAKQGTVKEMPRGAGTNSGAPPAPDIDEQSDEPPVPKEKITVFDDEATGLESGGPSGAGKLQVTIAVPHSRKSAARVFIYPWPVRPPKIKKFPRPLPVRTKAVKQTLLNNGYVSRTSLDWPYPPGGWRWQYAFQKAKDKSDLSVPHSIVEHYLWADRMVHYMLPELQKINAHEKKRVEAYLGALKTFNDNFTVIRNKALKRGLEPKELTRIKVADKFGKHFESQVPAGHWWIIGTHKCPGLKYDWWYPIDLKNGQSIRIVLNEANAIFIEGGW